LYFVSGKEVDHLAKLGFTVIGSQCAMTVLKHNIQLKKDLTYPVWNLTMLGTLICFSNIEPKLRVHFWSWFLQRAIFLPLHFLYLFWKMHWSNCFRKAVG